jgi:hypothetical protein
MPTLQQVFRADAVAIGGYVVRPIPAAVPSVTAKVPLLGGSARQREQKSSFLGFIQFGHAEATATGFVSADGEALTQSHAIVEDLAVGDRLRVSRCSVGVTSRQRRGEPPEIIIQEAQVRGLIIDDFDVQIDFDFWLNSHPTLESLDKERAHRRPESSLGSPQLSDRQPRTIVTDLGPKFENFPVPKKLRREGNAIVLPDFGSIHFGDVLIEESYRRVTLLRFQLGSPTEGQVECCSTKGGSFSF